MNHWLTEELTRLKCAEQEREIEELLMSEKVDSVQANSSVVARAALMLSDWLIAIGEGLRQHYENSTSISTWVDSRKFAR